MAYSPIVELFRNARRTILQLREGVRELVCAGLQVDAPTDHPSKKTPLQLAASNAVTDFGGGGWTKASLAALEEMLAMGAKVDVAHPKSGMQAIHYAARYATVPVVLKLIEAGANPNAVDASGERPIFMCLERQAGDEQRFEIFCALLANGVDPSLKSASGRSLLQSVKGEKFTREVRRAILEWGIHQGAPFEPSQEDETDEPSASSGFSGMQPL